MPHPSRNTRAIPTLLESGEVLKRRRLIANWFRRKFGNGLIDSLGEQKRHFVKENAFFQLVQSLNDAQTFGALALLGSGFHAVTYRDLSSYHWRLIAQLGWLSAITNMVTLTIMRRFLHRDPLKKMLRLFLLFFLVVMAALATYPSGDLHWSVARPARCYYEFGPGRFVDAHWKDFLSVEGLASEGILLYGFLIRGIPLLLGGGKLLPLVRCLRRTFRRGKDPRVKGRQHKTLRFASKVIADCLGRVVFYGSWRNPACKLFLDMVVMQPLVAIVVVMRTMWAAYTSVASELYWAIFAGTWGIANIFITRSLYGREDENEWAVGQIVPLVLLLSPLIAAIECIGALARARLATKFHDARETHDRETISPSDDEGDISTPSPPRNVFSPLPGNRPGSPSSISHSISGSTVTGTPYLSYASSLPESRHSSSSSVLKKPTKSRLSSTTHLQSIDSGLEVIHLLPNPKTSNSFNTGAFTYIHTLRLHQVPRSQHAPTILNFLVSFHTRPWFIFLILQISLWVTYFTLWVFSSRIYGLYPILTLGLYAPEKDWKPKVDPRPVSEGDALPTDTLIQVLVWSTLVFPISLVWFVLMWHHGTYHFGPGLQDGAHNQVLLPRTGNQNVVNKVESWLGKHMSTISSLMLSFALFLTTTLVWVHVGYPSAVVGATLAGGLWFVSCILAVIHEVRKGRPNKEHQEEGRKDGEDNDGDNDCDDESGLEALRQRGQEGRISRGNDELENSRAEEDLEQGLPLLPIATPPPVASQEHLWTSSPFPPLPATTTRLSVGNVGGSSALPPRTQSQSQYCSSKALSPDPSFNPRPITPYTASPGVILSSSLLRGGGRGGRGETPSQVRNDSGSGDEDYFGPYQAFMAPGHEQQGKQGQQGQQGQHARHEQQKEQQEENQEEEQHEQQQQQAPTSSFNPLRRVLGRDSRGYKVLSRKSS